MAVFAEKSQKLRFFNFKKKKKTDLAKINAQKLIFRDF